MTEQEKMLKGMIYDPSDAELDAKRIKAHKLSKDFNDTYEDEIEKRALILKQLIPNIGEGTAITSPVYFDYGEFTTIGSNSFANFNLTVLDCCPVTIGDDVFIGPNCSLLTPIHPMLSEERKMRVRSDGTLYDLEYAAPITIEDGCWIAGDVKVCGGVTIGKNSVIGAGSVVTKDIPSNVFAAGNPCRVIRAITKSDSIFNKKDLFEKTV